VNLPRRGGGHITLAGTVATSPRDRRGLARPAGAFGLGVPRPAARVACFAGAIMVFENVPVMVLLTAGVDDRETSDDRA
jgi:hypothetical protein